jgi:hypothetical protein
MNVEKLKEVLVAVADVVGAVARLRAVVPADMNVCPLGDEVERFANNALVLGLYEVPKKDDSLIAPMVRAARKDMKGIKASAVKGQMPKRQYVRKDKLGDPTGAPAVAPSSGVAAARPAMRSVCVDCSCVYEKTSNVQKRCPKCAASRKAQACGPLRAPTAGHNPAATPERLAAIKAADKKVDTIGG